MSWTQVEMKWYDAFFLAMLAVSAIVISINWEKYRSCTYPLQIWIMVDYATIFVFRSLMFIDSGLSAGLRLHNDNSQMSMRFKGRVIVLSCLGLGLYPFLWAWTVIGCIWFTNSRNCIPEGQKWGFLVWLIFSYSALICIACLSTGKWLIRRQLHLQRASHNSEFSNLQVLVDLIRAPEWAIQNATSRQEIRGALNAATYHPAHFLTQSQRDLIEGLIQQLPKFQLKAVPTDCNECPICLEEFCAGSEVRGLPCAHNFHVHCIDEWLRLSIKCPRCRCSVFPNLDLSALESGSTTQLALGIANVYFGTNVPIQVPTGDSLQISRYVRAPISENNLL